MKRPADGDPSLEAPLPIGADRARLLTELELRYPEIQYALVQFVSEHLADSSKTFGGDLALPLVLAIIGQSYLSCFISARAAGKDVDVRGISALRIADVTGLPRETVRRKLAVLAEKGWIERTPSGWVLVVFAEGGGAGASRSEPARPARIRSPRAPLHERLPLAQFAAQFCGAGRIERCGRSERLKIVELN